MNQIIKDLNICHSMLISFLLLLLVPITHVSFRYLYHQPQTKFDPTAKFVTIATHHNVISKQAKVKLLFVKK
jgi:hypothetical protein